MKNTVLMLSFILSCFSVFAQRNSTTETIIVNPKYKEIENILKTELPHHQQVRDTTDSSQIITIRICSPSRANMIASPLTIIKYWNKEYKSSTSNKGGALGMIDPKDISSINILKTQEQTQKYGDDAKNGVIIVTIKDEKAGEFSKALKKRKKLLKQTED
jgi:aminopeptidase-like protein